MLAHGHGYPQSGNVIHCDGAQGVSLPRLSRVTFLNSFDSFVVQRDAVADNDGNIVLVLDKPASVADNELVTAL